MLVTIDCDREVFSYARSEEKLEKLARDAGIAPYIEPFTLLVGRLAYEGRKGPAAAYRFEWLEERDDY